MSVRPALRPEDVEDFLQPQAAARLPPPPPPPSRAVHEDGAPLFVSGSAASLDEFELPNHSQAHRLDRKLNAFLHVLVPDCKRKLSVMLWWVLVVLVSAVSRLQGAPSSSGEQRAKDEPAIGGACSFAVVQWLRRFS